MEGVTKQKPCRFRLAGLFGWKYGVIGAARRKVRNAIIRKHLIGGF